MKFPVDTSEPVTLKSPVILPPSYVVLPITILLADTALNVTLDVVETSCPIDICCSNLAVPSNCTPSCESVTPVPCCNISGFDKPIPISLAPVPVGKLTLSSESPSKN